MPSHDMRYDIVLRPQLADIEGHPHHGAGLRTATVEATGTDGRSGYPRYAGQGVVADIDPRTHSVEAITVDGEELPYGWVAQVSEGPAPETDAEYGAEEGSRYGFGFGD